MKSLWSLTGRGLAAGLLVGLLVSPAAAQSDDVGVVRISKPRQLPVHASVKPGMTDEMLRGQLDDETTTTTASYADVTQAAPAPAAGGETYTIIGDCDSRSYKKQMKKIEKECQKACKKANKDCDCDGGCKHHACFGYFASKFGCFCPNTNAGWFGHYSRVYPQDVNYFDQRDGQMFAAEGYGIPIAVPLAPVVGHTYNYSWGVPSSRLTPISNVAPR